ncbi:MAG: hypothetical protein JSS02_33735 [Planctomycetes bacterium]|nr:hypothetical protein [Planctomycetota bacterium]
MAKGIAAATALVLVVFGVFVYFLWQGTSKEPAGSNEVANQERRQQRQTPAEPAVSPHSRPAAEMPATAGDVADQAAETRSTEPAVEPVSAAPGMPPANAEAPPTATAPVAGSIRERPLFAGWHDPQLVLIISGEQHGYVEPCGCSLNQLGGLSRRADLIRQLQERGWTTTAFDVGGLVNNPNRKQAKLKFDMMTKCLTDMKYAGVANGVEELQLSFDFLSYHRPDELPFLGSNLLFFDDPTFTGAPLLKRVITIGTTKLGVLAVFGPELDETVRPNGQENGGFEFKILPPDEVIRKQLAELKTEKPDLLILLSHSKLAASKELAAKFPEFDIVAASGGPEDADPRPNFIGDKTLFIAPGQKGKRVPVVGFFPGKGKEQLRYELVDLDDKRFKESPRMAEHMRYYQEELLKERNLVATEPAIDDPRNFHPITGAPVEASENPFVGAKVCGECHTSAYEVWKETGHAKATETLKHGRDHRPDFISRLYDPECIACHVTGWDPKKVVRYNTGYTGNENPPDLLTGQQCENCHGPGGRHSQLEQLLKAGKLPSDDIKQDEIDGWRKFVKVSLKNAYDMCAKCHDGDNDPNFKVENFNEYWDKVAHPGKD